jgi:cell division protein FtsL
MSYSISTKQTVHPVVSEIEELKTKLREKEDEISRLRNEVVDKVWV